MFERDKEEPAQPRGPDRGRPHGRLLRRRARLPDPSRRVRAARHHARGRRGRRSSAWPPGSGSTRGWPRPPPRPRKLTALGVQLDVSALDIAEARLTADEPSFDVFWEATQERTPVEFEYRRSGQTQVVTRHLQPWGVVRYSGRWYAVGLDTDRGEERVFRLSARPGRGPARRPPGVVRRAARHRRTRHRQAPRARADDRARRRAGPHGRPGWRCAATPRAIEAGVAGPGRPHRLGPPGRLPLRARPRRRAARLRRRPVRRGACGPARVRDRRPARPCWTGERRERPEAGRERRQGAGGPAADAGAVPARPRPDPARGRGRRPRRDPRSSWSRTSRCC